MVLELRSAALRRATTLRDVRVAEVLRRGSLDIRERADRGWESSRGVVRAVDVTVVVDGYALGLVEGSPAVRDGVVATIAAEAPSAIGASVVDLAIVWGLRERGIGSGYRDESFEFAVRDDGEDVRRALIGFFFARGNETSARALSTASFEVGAHEIDVHGASTLDVALLEASLSTLFGRRMRVQIVRRP